MKVRLVFSFS